MKNFVEACKKHEKNIKPEDKLALKAVLGDNPDFAGLPF